jgi:YfiH family protein
MKKWHIYKIFDKYKKLIAGTTKRDRNREFDFSLALHTGEDRDKILKNRGEFKKEFPPNFKFISQYQVHSNRVVDVDNLELSNSWEEFTLNSDGFVTTKKRVVLNILTADCTAVLAYSPDRDIIGAVHAGWRGVRGEIAVNMVKLMEKKGAKADKILIAVSPAIKGCCYEVGEEVAREFADYPQAITKRDGKIYLDITDALKIQLIRYGVKEENIEVSPICTACSNSDYFSYRKECGCSGRFVSFIAMDS